MSFPFDLRFQLALLRLVVDDDAFAGLAVKHFKPSYFENPVHRWIYQCAAVHWDRYEHAPSFTSLYEYMRQLDDVSRATYMPILQQLESVGRVDAQFIGDRVVEFIKRNKLLESFEAVKMLYNAGKLDEAVDLYQRSGEEILSVSLGEIDRGFFFEELGPRQKHRASIAAAWSQHTFATGIDDLDQVLNGGLSLGELGMWIAAMKVGKSFLLTWLVFYAVRTFRIPILVVVLEDSRQTFEDRLDAMFADTLINLMSRGEISTEIRRRLDIEYAELRRLIVVRSFVKEEAAVTGGGASVADIYYELRELRNHYGFHPRMIVVDYGDLLRTKGAETEQQHQNEAFKRLKILAGQGYAVWTASQLQREHPRARKDKKYLARAYNISDCIGKVRHVDFWGSINRTDEEAANEEVRLLADGYRKGPAGRVIHLKTDYKRGRFLKSIVHSENAPNLEPGVEEFDFEAA